MILPGEIYMADLGQGGRHPVIVLSRETLNRGQYVLVAVCTSSRYHVRQHLPNCVPFTAGSFGLTADCVAQCENIVSIERHTLDARPLGTLDDATLRDVIRAVGYVMDADCEPI